DLALQVDNVGRGAGHKLGLIEGRQIRPLLVEPFDLDAGMGGLELGELLLEQRFLVGDVPGQDAELLVGLSSQEGGREKRRRSRGSACLENASAVHRLLPKKFVCGRCLTLWQIARTARTI